ncbi:MAG: SDR family NAD(P)-dependent oxidoreductase, partial [Myxococcota bacterium]|nr:SDR family NAD(P)-dependent oxidoreductase [Myxococcota bacterium]
VGGAVSTHLLSVADKEAMYALPEQVVAEHGGVHILVNNAGVTVAKPFAEHSMDDWEWVIGVNLWGVIYGCTAFLDHLLVAEEAHIVNVSSLFGIVGVPSQTSYCTTKFAVRGFTESLQEELRGTQVGTTVVHPGGIRTNIVQASRTDDDEMRARMARFFDKTAIPPEQAADRIVGAIESNQPRLLITREAYAIDALRRIVPAWGNQLAVRALMRTMGVSRRLEHVQQKAIRLARKRLS